MPSLLKQAGASQKKLAWKLIIAYLCIQHTTTSIAAMKDVVFNRYIRMFDLLDVETKLELLTKLTENINIYYIHTLPRALRFLPSPSPSLQ
jgi:nitric oxide reductase activation protein